MGECCAYWKNRVMNENTFIKFCPECGSKLKTESPFAKFKVGTIIQQKEGFHDY